MSRPAEERGQLVTLAQSRSSELLRLRAALDSLSAFVAIVYQATASPPFLLLLFDLSPRPTVLHLPSSPLPPFKTRGQPSAGSSPHLVSCQLAANPSSLHFELNPDSHYRPTSLRSNEPPPCFRFPCTTTPATTALSPLPPAYHTTARSTQLSLLRFKRPKLHTTSTCLASTVSASVSWPSLSLSPCQTTTRHAIIGREGATGLAWLERDESGQSSGGARM